MLGSHYDLSAKGLHPPSDGSFGSVLQSHVLPIGSCFFLFFLPEIESIENRQTHSCQFVQSCGFCQGLQTRAGLPDNEGKLFQFLWVQSASAEFGFKQMNNKLKGTVK